MVKSISTEWEEIFRSSEKKNNYLEYVSRWEEKIGAFLEFNPDLGLKLASGKGVFEGVPFAVKDNLAVETFHLTCGSRILKNFLCPYTATAVKKLIDEGAVVVGKTNMDEFGMGSSTDNSALKTTSNPWDLNRVTGGSSGGSAAAVAAGLVPFALGTDTGGSIRQPAAFCGVYGFKPTYGVVSRYGLVAYASSLETVGVLAKNISAVREIFEVIRGEDPMDHTSLEYTPSGKIISEPVLGVLGGDLGLDEETERSYRKTIDRLNKLGFPTIEIDLPTMEYVVPSYYTIAMAEASANLARYDGIRYGYRPEFSENPDELVKTARNRGFGDEVKLRILIGTYVLRSGFQEQYYVRAQKIRTAIREDFARVFSEVDIILMPVFPVIAFKHGSEGLDQFQQKLADKFTSSVNLAGLPALAFPASVEGGLPVGMQFISPPFEEERLFRVAEVYEREFPPADPPGYSADWR